MQSPKLEGAGSAARLAPGVDLVEKKEENFGGEVKGKGGTSGGLRTFSASAKHIQRAG